MNWQECQTKEQIEEYVEKESGLISQAWAKMLRSRVGWIVPTDYHRKARDIVIELQRRAAFDASVI